MARPCIFCGSTGKLSAEHVFPDWSQPFLVSPYGPGTHQRQILRSDGNNDEWSYEGDPATATVRTVCEPYGMPNPCQGVPHNPWCPSKH